MSCVSSESTKEELVESIRALQKQVAEHALNDSAAHGKMVGLQDLLDEKNEQIRAITEQSIVLSEKVVENEETIGALIRQMEQMRSTLHTDGGTNPDNNKLPFLGEGKVIGVATKEGSRNTPKVMARHDGRSSTGEQAHEVSKGQVIGSHGGSSVTTHTGDDIAAMENKMRELQEVNTLYAAIVSQHDDDDKSRRNISYRSNVATSQDDSDIRNLRERCEQLQRNGDRMASENASVRQVNVSLREENSRLELEMAEMLKWKLSVEANMASSIPIAEAREQPDVLGATEPQSTAVNLIGGAPTCLISPSVATASLPQQLRSLPPISIRHPTTQEQELLKRIDLYTSHIAQRDAYEADRQRSFSEMEAARALLFSNLNEKLTNQREEIKHLQSLNTCQSNVNPDAHVIDDFHQLRASDVACAATSPIKEDSFPVFWANLVNDELMDRLHVELDAADALFHLMTNHPVHLIRWIDDRKPDMERVDPVLTLSSSGEQNTDDHSREGIDECVSCSLIEEKMNLAFDEVLNYFEALVKPLNATKVRSFSGSLMESLYALQSEDREDLLLVRMKAHQRSLDARSPIRSISEIRGEDYVGDFEHMQQQRSLGENRDGVSSCKFASFDTTVENGTPSPPHIVASHCVERSLPSETEELMISPLSETDGAGIRDCQDMTKTDQQHPDRTNCARQGSSLRDQHEVGEVVGPGLSQLSEFLLSSGGARESVGHAKQECDGESVSDTKNDLPSTGVSCEHYPTASPQVHTSETHLSAEKTLLGSDSSGEDITAEFDPFS